MCTHIETQSALVLLLLTGSTVAELKADVHTSQEYNFRWLLILAGIIFSITASLIFFVSIMTTNKMIERFSLGKKKSLPLNGMNMGCTLVKEHRLRVLLYDQENKSNTTFSQSF